MCSFLRYASYWIANHYLVHIRYFLLCPHLKAKMSVWQCADDLKWKLNVNEAVTAKRMGKNLFTRFLFFGHKSNHRPLKIWKFCPSKCLHYQCYAHSKYDKHEKMTIRPIRWVECRRHDEIVMRFLSFVRSLFIFLAIFIYQSFSCLLLREWIVNIS